MTTRRAAPATPATPGGSRLDQELAALPRHIWDPVFVACAKQIRARASVSGTIVVTDPEIVRRVEGMGCVVRSGKVRLAELDRAMRGGRIRDGLLAAVELWTGAAILTKREERNAEARAWEQQMAAWRTALTTSDAHAADDPDVADALEAWLTGAARALKGWWRKHPESTHRAALRAIRGARRAPGVRTVAEAIALPVFAQHVAADPHAFDANRRAGRLLIGALRARFLDGVHGFGRDGAEERAAVLDAAGLSTDGVSSRVVVFGLDGDHPLLAAANVAHEPVTLTQFNLNRLASVRVPTGVAYVVENPAVFTSIVRRLMTQAVGARPSPTVICTSGQFGVTAAGVLDRIAAGGARIRYSGDFDRAGVRIADRVWRRYPEQMVPWRMDVATYRAAGGLARREGTPLASEDRGAVTTWPVEREQLLTSIARDGRIYQEAIVCELVSDVCDARSAGDTSRDPR